MRRGNNGETEREKRGQKEDSSLSECKSHTPIYIHTHVGRKKEEEKNGGIDNGKKERGAVVGIRMKNSGPKLKRKKGKEGRRYSEN